MAGAASPLHARARGKLAEWTTARAHHRKSPSARGSEAAALLKSGSHEKVMFEEPTMRAKPPGDVATGAKVDDLAPRWFVFRVARGGCVGAQRVVRDVVFVRNFYSRQVSAASGPQSGSRMGGSGY